MTTAAKTTSNGQFKPGQSGNPAGARLRRPKALLTPGDLDRIVLEVAASQTIVSVGGERKRVTLYEANVVGLGLMNPASRLASKDFLEITNRAAHRFERVHERAGNGSGNFQDLER